MKTTIKLFILSLFTFCTITFAQIPKTISYQGILTDANGIPKPDGSYSFTFKLYELSSGGTAIWTETKTLTTTKGLFSTYLGNTTAFGTGVKFDKQYYLGIKVGTEQEMTDRIPLSSVGYSISSIKSDTAEYAKNSNEVNGFTSNSIPTPNTLLPLDGSGEIPGSVINGVVKSINDITDDIVLSAGNNIQISQNGNTMTISATGNGIQSVTASSPLSSSGGQNPNLSLNSFNGDNYIDNNSISSSKLNFSPAIYPVQASNISNGAVTSEKIFWPITYGNPSVTSGQINVGNTNTSANLSGVYNGVYGTSSTGAGVVGNTSISGNFSGGVYGSSSNTAGNGVIGEVANGGSTAYSIWGKSAGSGYAGYFNGKTHVVGTFSATTKNFIIDHPLDPLNKYLYHSCVESPDMKNIYDGLIDLDKNGEAIVELPNYFEALNKDFRYQLTCVGGFANVYIAEEIKENKFKIAGGITGMKVSWQVTGIRKDAYAEKNRTIPEVEKEQENKGKYLNPEVFGLQKEQGIGYKKENEGEKK
ncbi:MAG: hypothetical protein KGZ58_13145 [Ignavibacteriales bacterium]|nr:hypothetical protein [Ignavibacteriales bacterium]